MQLSRTKCDISWRLKVTVGKGISLQCPNTKKGIKHQWESQDHFFLPVVSFTRSILTVTPSLLSFLYYFHLSQLFRSPLPAFAVHFQNGVSQEHQDDYCRKTTFRPQNSILFWLHLKLSLGTGRCSLSCFRKPACVAIYLPKQCWGQKVQFLVLWGCSSEEHPWAAVAT